MKRLFVSIVGIGILLCAMSASAVVNKVVGLNADATGSPTPVPLSGTFICDGDGAHLDCPQYFAPDWVDTTGQRLFGITNRVNPPRCVKSVNGGVTWGLCDATTASPFTGVLDNFGASFTVASNGSLIAASNQGTDNCIIRRSTDYGVSWTTVFTDTTATVDCSIAFTNPAPSIARCASANAYCVVIGRTTASFDLIAYYSTDNGANWTKGTAFNIVSGDEELGITVASDGASGILTRYVINYNSAGRKFATTSGGDWTITGLIPTPAGEVDGVNSRCSSGSMIFSGQKVLCAPGTNLTTTYHLFSISAGIAVNTANFIPPSGLTNAQSPDFMAVGFASGTAYFVGRDTTGTKVFGWVTRDSFSSAIQFMSLTPTTALITGCCRGDIVLWNGAIYFSSGSSGSTAFLGRITR